MAFPGTFNISYYKGDTYEFKVYPKNSVGGVFNLSNFAVKFYIANGRGSTIKINNVDTPVTQYECLATIGTDSTISCTIPPGVGRQLSANTTYVYDVEVRNPTTGVIYTVLTGNIAVTADISGAI